MDTASAAAAAGVVDNASGAGAVVTDSAGRRGATLVLAPVSVADSAGSKSSTRYQCSPPDAEVHDAIEECERVQQLARVWRRRVIGPLHRAAAEAVASEPLPAPEHQFPGWQERRREAVRQEVAPQTLLAVTRKLAWLMHTDCGVPSPPFQDDLLYRLRLALYRYVLLHCGVVSLVCCRDG